MSLPRSMTAGDLPPAIPSMWRVCKLGYRHEPPLMGLAFVSALLAALPDGVQPDTSSLRFGIGGAAPASAELLGRFEDRYGVPLIEGYGLSEGTCAFTLNPVGGPPRAGAISVALPGEDSRVPGADQEFRAKGREGLLDLDARAHHLRADGVLQEFQDLRA